MRGTIRYHVDPKMTSSILASWLIQRVGCKGCGLLMLEGNPSPSIVMVSLLKRRKGWTRMAEVEAC